MEGEALNRVRELAVAGVMLQRIAIFKNGVVVDAGACVVNERVKLPLAELMRGRADVLREERLVVRVLRHDRGVAVGLPAGLATVGTVVAADAATAFSQIHVVG